jgi:predicted nucleotide-binding protein
MSYIWYDLKRLKGGQIIEMEVATAVNVKLMSYESFKLYRVGLIYRFHGGYIKKSPSRLRVPYDGQWILVFDLNYEGYFQVKGVRVWSDDEAKNDKQGSTTTIATEETEAKADEPKSLVQLNKDKIFIVHGHDNHMKNAVARFVDKLGFEPVILHEQANKGKTIIEKLELYAQDIKMAIVLYSPDDTMADGKKRARQNVVFEHGLFVGMLTRERVIALYKNDNDIETLSDLSGVIYVKYEKGWQQEVEREIKAASL